MAYGIDWQAYFEIVNRQGGEVCAICGAPEEAIDHDHATGLVRGLLCRRCNQGLGSFRDDPALLRGAVAYLAHNFSHVMPLPHIGVFA